VVERTQPLVVPGALDQRRDAAGEQRVLGTVPVPGGWNRFAIEVTDLDGLVSRLRAAGARFRNDIVTGVGGRQILLEDSSGNPVELFEPAIGEARLSPAAS
jgi:hypothetical protein